MKIFVVWDKIENQYFNTIIEYLNFGSQFYELFDKAN